MIIVGCHPDFFENMESNMDRPDQFLYWSTILYIWAGTQFHFQCIWELNCIEKLKYPPMQKIKKSLSKTVEAMMNWTPVSQLEKKNLLGELATSQVLNS